MALKLITAPTAEPVTLDEVKSRLRIDSDLTDEDDWLTERIIAAREACESYHGWNYMQRQYELYLDRWPHKRYIDILKPPLQSVESVKYYDIDDTEYTFSDYLANAVKIPGRVTLKANCQWPVAELQPENGIVIAFTCGYASADDVPQLIKDCITASVCYWWQNRGKTDVPDQILRALAPSRMWPI